MNGKSYNNILISGGCGFIGSHFIRHLIEKYPQYRVFNLDLLTYAGANGNLRDLEGNERYVFIKGDIGDEKLLNKIFRNHKFSAVVNFAAETHVDRSIFNSAAFIHTNIEGVHGLITACRAHKVPRFVQISTDEVYGNIDSGHSTEESPLNPSNPYSASKAAADLLILSYINTFKFPAVIVRGSNNFGTHQYPEKLIPLAIINLLSGSKIPVHGDGCHVRSWLHVLDFCEAVDVVLHRAPDHQIYNVSGNPKKNIEILQAIAKIAGKDLDSHKFHTKDRPGADLRYAPDSSKLKRELGWVPQRPVEEHLAPVVNWYFKNDNWWKPILANKDVWDHYQKQFQAYYY